MKTTPRPYQIQSDLQASGEFIRSAYKLYESAGFLPKVKKNHWKLPRIFNAAI